MSVEGILAPTFSLSDVRGSPAQSLVVSMHALRFGYHNGMISFTWSPERSHTDSVMEDTVAVQAGRTVLKQRRKVILLDEHHLYSCVCQLKEEGGNEWAVGPLHFTQVIRRDGQAIGQT